MLVNDVFINVFSQLIAGKLDALDSLVPMPTAVRPPPPPLLVSPIEPKDDAAEDGDALLRRSEWTLADEENEEDDPDEEHKLGEALMEVQLQGDFDSEYDDEVDAHYYETKYQVVDSSLEQLEAAMQKFASSFQVAMADLTQTQKLLHDVRNEFKSLRE